MRGLRYAEVSQKEQKFLDLTSLTVEEFDQLVPSFEEAFQDRMKQWCLDGKKRSGRPYTTYANSPVLATSDIRAKNEPPSWLSFPLYLIIYLSNWW